MSHVIRSTIGLMIVTVVVKILGFIRELVLASTYGTSIYSDAYLTSMSIPMVIFAIIGTGIGTIFIPIYFDVKSKLGNRDSLKFVNNIINIISILCITLTIVGFIFTEQIVSIFAFGFDAETFRITVYFTRVLFLSLVFTGLSYIMTYYLQANGNFIIPGLISLPRNIIIITSMVLSLKYGLDIMIWGSLLGIISEFIFQIPFAYKSGYKYNLSINLKDEYIKKAIVLLAPVMVSVAVNQINSTVDRALASTLAEGSISALNYANKLNGFVMAIFITSLVSVIYPTLSKLSSNGEYEKFKESIVNSINSVVILVIPISIGAISLAEPIVTILFKRGAFDSNAVEMTTIALIMYSIGMVSFGLRDILGRIFFSLQDTKTPMKNGIICMIINIMMNMILIKNLKHAGLALATSVSGIVSILLFFWSLKKKIGDFRGREIVVTTFKTIVVSIPMGIIARVSYKLFISLLGINFFAQIISISVSVVIGGAVYLTGVSLMKIKEVEFIIDTLKCKLRIKGKSIELN